MRPASLVLVTWTLLGATAAVAQDAGPSPEAQRWREAAAHTATLRTAQAAAERSDIEFDLALANYGPSISLAAPNAVQSTVNPEEFDPARLSGQGSGQLNLGVRLPGGTQVTAGGTLAWSATLQGPDKDPELKLTPGATLALSQRLGPGEAAPGTDGSLEVLRTARELARRSLERAAYSALLQVAQNLATLDNSRAAQQTALAALGAARDRVAALRALAGQGRSTGRELTKAASDVRTAELHLSRAGAELAAALATWHRETGLEPWSPSDDDLVALEAELDDRSRLADLAEERQLSLQSVSRLWSAQASAEAEFATTSVNLSATHPPEAPWQLALSFGLSVTSAPWSWSVGQAQRRRLEQRHLGAQLEDLAQVRNQQTKFQTKRRELAERELQEARLELNEALAHRDELRSLASQGLATEVEVSNAGVEVAQAEASVVSARWAVVLSRQPLLGD